MHAVDRPETQFHIAALEVKVRRLEKERAAALQKAKALQEQTRALGARLRSERALRESEKKLRHSRFSLTAGSLTQFGAWEWELTTSRWAFSDEWLAIHGCTDPPSTLAELLALIHPDDRAGIEQALGRMQRGASSSEIEYRIIRPDGDVRVIKARGQHVLEANRARGKVYGFAQDFTDCKRAQEQLLSTALFPEENPSPVLRMAADGSLLYANQAAADLLTQWQCSVGTAVPEFVRRELAPVMKSGTNRELEIRCGQRDLSFVLVPIIEHGYINFYGRDITKTKLAKEALRQSEAWLKRTQEIAYLGSWDFDLVANTLTWSDETYRIFGLQPQEFGATYEAFLEAVHPDDRAAVDKAYTDSLQRGEDVYEVEHRVVRKSTGEIRFVHEKCQHYRDENGRIVRSSGMAHDITERKQVEEVLREAKVAAEDASRAKSEFLANLGHEIRTPITIFMNAIEHLLQMDEDMERRELLKMADEYANRLHVLLTEILDLSQIAARQIELVEQPFNLGDCVRAAMEKFAQPARKKGLNLELELATDVPAMVVGDPDRLRQVLINLIGNSVKFTHQGSIRVSVQGCGESLHFAISDTGIGIPEKKMELVFQPFAQGDGSSTRKYEGVGLGLPLCRGLIERMGGNLSVESREGEGSRFTFTLPMKPFHDAAP